MKMHHDFWSGETLTRADYLITMKRRLKRAEQREPLLEYSEEMWKANREIIDGLRAQIDDMEQMG